MIYHGSQDVNNVLGFLEYLSGFISESNIAPLTPPKAYFPLPKNVLTLDFW